jgi:hypothetical protein
MQVKAFRRRVSVIPDEGLDKMAAVISDGKITSSRGHARPNG